MVKISNGIYLDNNATTKVDEEVLSAMTPFFAEHYGNSSSSHAGGQIASRALFESRNLILKTLDEFKGNKTKTAEKLKVDYKTLLTKLKEYAIK